MEIIVWLAWLATFSTLPEESAANAHRLRTNIDGRPDAGPPAGRPDEVGCERIFEDAASGAGDRPALRDAFDHLRAGDTLVAWRLDRLGRSLKDFIARADTLRSQGVGLRSLKEAIDTDSSTGQLVFHLFGALAEF